MQGLQSKNAKWVGTARVKFHFWPWLHSICLQ